LAGKASRFENSRGRIIADPFPADLSLADLPSADLSRPIFPVRSEHARASR